MIAPVAEPSTLPTRVPFSRSLKGWPVQPFMPTTMTIASSPTPTGLYDQRISILPRCHIARAAFSPHCGLGDCFPERMIRDFGQVLRIEEVSGHLFVLNHFCHIDLGTAARLHIVHHDPGNGWDPVDCLHRAMFGLEKPAGTVVEVALNRQQRIGRYIAYDLGVIRMVDGMVFKFVDLLAVTGLGAYQLLAATAEVLDLTLVTADERLLGLETIRTMANR